MKQKGNGKERHQNITIPVFAIVLSLAVGAVVIAVLGKNPFSAYLNLLQGSGLAPKGKYAGGRSMLTDFLSFVDYWTPMILAALAVAVALKAGLFNIGVSGQMLTAGFAASVTVGYSTLAAPIAKPLAVLIALAAGALLGGLIGWLKCRFHINEVVSSIMLNYIAEYIIAFFIYTKYIDPVSRQSLNISAAARLTLKEVQLGSLKCDIPLGFLLAVFAALVMDFVFRRTTFGYELKAIGSNRKAAKYAGIRAGRGTVLAMMISGGLAGMAGAAYYLGYFGSMQPKTLADTGFDAVAVSLLGNSNPMGILAASFLITVISKGSTYMSSKAGLDAEIASVITGLILLFSACGGYIRYRVKRSRDRLESKAAAWEKEECRGEEPASRKNGKEGGNIENGKDDNRENHN